MDDLNATLAEIDTLKARLDALRPLDNASVAKALAVEYTFESNRIEGNTLTLRETDLVIHKGLTVAGKSMREHLEAINHYEAVLFLRDLVRQTTALTQSLVKQFHALVLRGIDRDNAGRYRSVPVSISGSRHIPPQPWQVPKLMEDCFAFYRENQAGMHPVVLAAEIGAGRRDARADREHSSLHRRQRPHRPAGDEPDPHAAGVSDCQYFRRHEQPPCLLRRAGAVQPGREQGAIPSADRGLRAGIGAPLVAGRRGTMKLQFDANQGFQLAAVAVVVDLFDGQPEGAPEARNQGYAGLPEAAHARSGQRSQPNAHRPAAQTLRNFYPPALNSTLLP